MPDSRVLTRCHVRISKARKLKNFRAFSFFGEMELT